jgi:hypothetical protein
MKANELRIGNWIYYKPYGKDFEMKSFFGLCNIETNPELFEPIQLTEEWLLRFGAKELKPKRGFLKDFVLKTVRIELSNSGNFYYKNSGFILESVHQLQNLYFALTGKEL